MAVSIVLDSRSGKSSNFVKFIVLEFVEVAKQQLLEPTLITTKIRGVLEKEGEFQASTFRICHWGKKLTFEVFLSNSL